jgi:flagellar hook-length control protein FliK
MGARVSVTTTSHASGAGRSGAAGGTSRDSTPSAQNGFSSQLSAAASRHPTTPDQARPDPAKPDPASEPHPDSSTPPSAGAKGAPKNASSASTATANQATAGATHQTPATTGDQAQSAAATVTEADASSIDADLATQEGTAPDKAAGKSRSSSTENSSGATDPATLALLFAASGLQVDPRAGTGQQSGQGSASSNGSSSAATDDNAAAAIAGAVAAASMATTTLSLQPQPVGAANASATAGLTISGDTAVSNAVTAAATQGLQLGADSLQLGGSTGDSSSPDAALLQNKSSAPDSLQPQPSSATSANGLPEMVRALSAAVPQASGVERTVSLPVSDRNWGSAVGNQVQWMVGNNIQSATLQVSPDHLGPVEVRIDVQSSQVNVSFTAAHPDTRSALEQSVPQLRAMLAGGGLTLGHTTVQQEARSNSHYPQSPSRGSSNSTQTVDSISISSARGLGLIDEYA